MNPHITKLALAFAFAALLAAPQAPAAIPGGDGFTAAVSADGYSHVDPSGGTWVRIGRSGGTIAARQPVSARSRHHGGTSAATAPSFAWSDVGLGAAAVIAALLGLGLAAAAVRRTVRRAPAF